MRRPRAVRHPEMPSLATIDEGGVTSALGFTASGVHAGFYEGNDRLDCALVSADVPCPCAALFTRNAFSAAPVDVSRDHLRRVSFGFVRAVLINSGNANALTGENGLEVARRSASLASGELGCREDEVLVASTGIMGSRPPVEPFERGVPLACRRAARDGGHDAARAILTSGAHPKEAAVSYRSTDAAYRGCTFTVGGMAKGPEMLLVLTTDAPLSPALAYRALEESASASFNKVIVDAGSSTNDSCFLLASGYGAKPGKPIREGTQAFREFSEALKEVSGRLARCIASDEQCVSCLITVHVVGAFDEADADRVARSVAHSLVVRSTVAGRHANWSHIVSSIGYADALFMRERVSVDVMGVPVLRRGALCPFDEQRLLREAGAAEACALVTDSWEEIAEYIRRGERRVEVRRETRETRIAVRLDLDGRGASGCRISTGLRFLDHMLEQIVHHGGVALDVEARGDLDVDEHHTAEDVAIALGEAIDRALGSKAGIARYGFALPMDDCRALVLLDFGGRIDFEWDAEFRRERIGDMPTELFSHFFRSLCCAARCNLQIAARGGNEHHKAEAIFKAFARALRMAVARQGFGYDIPSSKGVL